MSSKPSNPKDIVGIKKVSMSCLPWRVLWNVALAMQEGALKYGRHNYRAVGVRASVYFDAVHRHLGSWWEGEDIDTDSKLSHIDKAIASLMVLRDSMLAGNIVDDRPISNGFDLQSANQHASMLLELHADKTPHHYSRVSPLLAAPVFTTDVTQVLPSPIIRVLAYHDSKKIAIIKAIRTITGMGLKEAKDLSEMEPVVEVPVKCVTEEEARHLLKMAGAML